jgi:hypothetical protein
MVGMARMPMGVAVSLAAKRGKPTRSHATMGIKPALELTLNRI